MKIKGFLKHNYAVAGVIEALLLIGLVAIIISIIQLQYIPIIMREKEATHMDEVANQFSTLKSVIEIQSIMGITGSDDPYVYSPISSPITLGSEQLPYFVTAAATGQVTLIDADDAGGIYRINILSDSGYLPPIPLTSIKYESSNHYFINQNYILEGGGIILNQSNGEVMTVNPGMTARYNDLLDEFEITYSIPLFKGLPGKKFTSGGGYGPPKICYVRTNYIGIYYESETVETLKGNEGHYIHIYTSYPDAWEIGMKDLLEEYWVNEWIHVNQPEPNLVEITPGLVNTITLRIKVIEIGVQVGPGVVISK